MSINLDTPIQYLKTIGPKRAELFSKIGVNNVKDILFYFPYRYLDRTTILNSSRVARYVASGFKDEITIIGKILDTEEITYGKKKIFKVTFKDEKGFFEAVWFQSIKYIKNKFKIDDYLAISAKPVITKYGHLQFAHPDFDKLSEEESNDFKNTGRIIPFYRIPTELKKIKFNDFGLRKIIGEAVEECLSEIKETLPKKIISNNNLLSITSTVKNKHFPENQSLLERANYRLKFEELFYIETLVALKKSREKKRTGFPFKVDAALVSKFLKSLEFDLTKAQLKVLHEIRLDMESNIPMNRLLQGDVGSGKTIVALIALIIALSNGKQAALMAPTEILAVQHFNTIKEFTSDLPIEVELLLGGQKRREKENSYLKMKSGHPAIYIGTHALIENRAEFSNLGFIIIDEQHRFGVAQRGKLITKSNAPDVLVMTATPIPRTLTMTVYGDLDLSIIDEMPSNRVPIKTYLRSDTSLPKIYKFIIDSVAKGLQAFVVYPLVEESEKLELKAAEKYFEELKTTYFKNLKVGLIHGKMKWDEKKLAMEQFAEKKFDVLISTTVIEVGINIPNANIMVINDAHRFGLSQLHQLRGRIGRGAEQGYCILVTTEALAKKQIDSVFSFEFLSDEQIAKNKTIIRLNALVNNTDGFKLAEIDMKLRGPGDIYGLKQSGLPDFKYANLVEDSQILEKVKTIAFNLIAEDPQLRNDENQIIRNIIIKSYSKNISYSNIA